MNLRFPEELGAESIENIREVVAVAANPVMLYSGEKDASVMLRLAQQAFYPGRIPFPMMHIDTGWTFREMKAFRDRTARGAEINLITYTNPRGATEGIGPFSHSLKSYTEVMKTEALKQALDLYGFDIALSCGRRDEENSLARESILPFCTADHRREPKAQRPELWRLYNLRVHSGETIRAFPLANWTEMDIWAYIRREQVPIVPLYFSAQRPVVRRFGQWIMVDDERLPLEEGEAPQMRSVRFSTLDCYPLTPAVESTASTIDEIVAETLAATTSQLPGRRIDLHDAGLVEREKPEGVF